METETVCDYCTAGSCDECFNHDNFEMAPLVAVIEVYKGIVTVIEKPENIRLILIDNDDKIKGKPNNIIYPENEHTKE